MWKLIEVVQFYGVSERWPTQNSDNNANDNENYNDNQNLAWLTFYARYSPQTMRCFLWALRTAFYEHTTTSGMTMSTVFIIFTLYF